MLFNIQILYDLIGISLSGILNSSLYILPFVFSFAYFYNSTNIKIMSEELSKDGLLSKILGVFVVFIYSIVSLVVMIKIKGA